MEVHHHSHADDPDTHRGRKKWTHYFWEFLMLFLAVFCGFLAEYQLEHKIEKERAKEYARALYDDIVSDTANLKKTIENVSKLITYEDTLMNEFSGWLKFESRIYLAQNDNYILPIKKTATELIALLKTKYHPD